MSDEEQQAAPQPEATESVPPLEDHHEEAMTEMTLEERQEALKRSRWNVFLYLGLAALMFGFALFPFPFSAAPLGDTYEQDLGFVWGPPLDGEDFTDVPIEIEITATNPPAESDTRIAVYLLNSDDCASSDILDIKRDSRSAPTHDYQYQISDKAPIVDEVVVFEFRVDGGGQCFFAEYVDKDDPGRTLSGAMEIDGSMWPNQVWAGIMALLFLGLSGFAFIGAQRHGKSVKELTEPGKKTTEDEVLETAPGPTGPPPKAPGPSGPPQAAGPSGPPQIAPATPEPVVQTASVEPTFEDAGNGYFFRKMPDGSYDQTVYVRSEDGSYAPYQQ